jgi:hypothetical protein
MMAHIGVHSLAAVRQDELRSDHYNEPVHLFCSPNSASVSRETETMRLCCSKKT